MDEVAKYLANLTANSSTLVEKSLKEVASILTNLVTIASESDNITEERVIKVG